ncbi:MAG: MurT ligase domain-containing protein [Patescibacteria group bacterium]|jgi:UDP-N-acetylmuramyl tripeptide synthase
MRLFLAIIIAKLASFFVRALNRGQATSLPGLLARKIDPQVLTKLSAKLKKGVIIVSGTNGKTTTTRLISNILNEENFEFIHNRAGANLLSGVTSSLLSKCSLNGKLNYDWAVFEVDEATVPLVAKQTNPKVVVLMNLFRDQLDRYGELEKLAKLWKETIDNLSGETKIILNADDPLVSSIAINKKNIFFYGVNNENYKIEKIAESADSKNCPNCKEPLVYSALFYSHIGKYHCPKCGLTRPNLNLSAEEIKLNSFNGSDILMQEDAKKISVHFPLPGFYNIYNVLAAAACCLNLDISFDKIKLGIEKTKAAFGRLEKFKLDKNDAILMLVKNPTGFNEVIKLLETDGKKKKMIITLNDNIPDGRDISWIWDVDFERLINFVDYVFVAGQRAEELVLRFKYAGLDLNKIGLEKDYDKLLEMAKMKLDAGETLYILPTYSSMLDLRNIIAKKGYLKQSWL